MELSWLEDFLSVVSEAHFARAAAQRNITPSAITRHIKALEHWAGEELLDRSQQPIRPTPAGRLFIPLAERMLEEAHGAKQTIREFTSQHEKDLVLSAYNSLALFELSHLIAQAKSSLGDFRSRIVTNVETTYDYLYCIENGTFDFFLCYRHPAVRMQIDRNEFQFIDLRSEGVFPYAAPSLAHVDLDDERGEPIPYLRHTGTAFMGRVVDTMLKDCPCRSRLKAVYETTLTQTLCNAAQAGLGVTWLPESVAKRANADLPLIRLKSALMSEVVITMIWSRRNTRPIVESFKEYCLDNAVSIFRSCG